MKEKTFKPNTIPNNPKDGSFDRNSKILENGGYEKYLGTFKKDGCRLEIIDGSVKTRSLKAPKSKLVTERFQPLADLCKKLNIIIEGEFYMHNVKFNAIYRFFSKIDVTDPKYKLKLEKAQAKNPSQFENDYDGLSIKNLTTFYEGLKFWLFDGIVLDRPDLVGYKERMDEILNRLYVADDYDNLRYLVFPTFFEFEDHTDVESTFNSALNQGWEGLILTHKDHEYKYGRNSLKQGTILKIKEDSLEFDGIVLDIKEGDQIKAGIQRGVNELGRSTTSGKKEDREPNGKAKSIVTLFEDGKTIDVSLKGFNDEAKRNLLKNKESFIGRHFKYKGMKPVKNVPRHAQFDCWRDEK